jgi:hypothetical protein
MAMRPFFAIAQVIHERPKRQAESDRDKANER